MCVKVLIPAYKPDDKLLSLIEQLIPFVGILVVDDGSGPEFFSLFQKARQLGATVLHHGQNRGKGAALKTGMANWQARRVCPGLYAVPPKYDDYIQFSDFVNALYSNTPTAWKDSG